MNWLCFVQLTFWRLKIPHCRGAASTANFKILYQRYLCQSLVLFHAPARDCAASYAWLCRWEGAESLSWQESWCGIARFRRDLATVTAELLHPQQISEFCTKDTCPKVWFFSTPLRVIVQMGGCRISELAGILVGYCKISPRSSHPSLQSCCIHSEFQNFAIHAAT